MNFQCRHCEKCFEDYQARHKHEYYIHKSELKYQCDYCDKKTYSKTMLTQHMDSCQMAIENGYEPRCYTCEVCCKQFKQKGNLDTHKEKEHNIPKPHTRISRNKLRKELASLRYEIREKQNIKSPKRFYVIDNRKENENQIVEINIIHFCKATAKQWCDNLNIIDAFWNMNWDEERKSDSKYSDVWDSFNSAIISLASDRPKQEKIITEIIQTFYVNN